MENKKGKHKRVYQITCKECGTGATMASPRAKYCSKTCNQRAYEKRKGLTKPEFIGETKPYKPIGQNKLTLQRLPQQQRQFIQEQQTETVSELDKLKHQRQLLLNAFQREVDRIPENVYRNWGAATGAVVGMKQLNKDDDLVTGGMKVIGISLIFGMVGKHIVSESFKDTDHRKKQERLGILKFKIDAINEEITGIELRQKQLSSFKRKKINDLLNSKPEGIISAEDYKKAIIPTLGFKEGYKYLMGDPSPGFYSVLTGSPGQGKSTFAVQFANYFQKEHGKVLFVAAEQRGINKPLQELLRRFKTKFDVETSPQTYDSKKWIETAKNYDLVIIDSATNLELSPTQIEDIRSNASNTSFLVLLQSTKDGKYKGSTEWEHNCDIFLKADDMKIYQTKSRYTKPAHIVVDPY